MVKRQTRIYFNGRFFEYPLQLMDALSKLGPLEAARCMLSYVREQFRPDEPTVRFEQCVRGRFGQRLYELSLPRV